ncbi:MAG TPA: hypothetical protein VND95_08570 [Stellaceae bacterium]|nr:hypothetical protein [Stellaceae bacterium]
MSAPAWTEVQLAIAGTLRLARGDRSGLAAFDTSIDGFWRSFRAGIICYPFYLLLLAFRVAAPQWAASGVATILVVETIAYVISWVAFPLMILPLARWLDREERFLAFMVAYNWSQIPQTALFVVVGLDRVTGFLPPTAGQFAEVFAAIAVLVYEWYIARVALAVGGAPAGFVVVVDLALGTLLSQVASSLY